MKLFVSIGYYLNLPLMIAAFQASGLSWSRTTSLSPITSTSTISSGSSTSTMGADILDETKLLEASTFPIPPDALIRRAKEVLSPSIALGTMDGGECLADEFEFCAAVVGPINRKQYLNALKSFNLQEAFDITPNFYNLSVDSMQPNRVYFFNRAVGIHTGTFMGKEAMGKKIEYPPQVHHLDFNKDGKVLEYGFYTVDRRQGNTGGLGGAFGFMYGIGKPLPIPECQPYKPSLQFRLFSWVGGLAQKFSKASRD